MTTAFGSCFGTVNKTRATAYFQPLVSPARRLSRPSSPVGIGSLPEPIYQRQAGDRPGCCFACSARSLVGFQVLQRRRQRGMLRVQCLAHWAAQSRPSQHRDGEDMDSSESNAEASTAYARIVVGVDGSVESVEALRRAAELAVKFGSTVVVISVWHYPVSYTGIPAGWKPDRDAQEVADEVADQVFGLNWPEWLTTDIRSGAPAQVLVEESRSSDLLVVGSRGRGGFIGLLLGSVSSQCAEHAACPVLIVHSPEIGRPLTAL